MTGLRALGDDLSARRAKLVASGMIIPDAGGWISGPSAPPPPLTSVELAAALGVNIRTLYRYVKKGWIRGFRTSSHGHWRFPRSEAELALRRMGFDPQTRLEPGR